jgi:(p)ppGpp synthase/HD superfamily hydrolase
MNDDQMENLRNTHLAPYIQLATALIGKSRHSGGNMFRHQMDTLAILIDYGYGDTVLLKASIIHDLLEDVPGFNRELVLSIDEESSAVLGLVLEVTRKPEEVKGVYLARLRYSGSQRAKVLKVADRISNMVSLGFVTEREFVERYTKETEDFVLPIAEEVNPHMARELNDLVASRRRFLDSSAI